MIADLRTIARALGGEVVGGSEILCPGPGHSPRDRSMSVKLSASSPDGFVAHSFAGDPWQDCRDHAARLLGIRRNETARRPSEAHRQPPPDPDEEVRHERKLAYVADLVAGLKPVRGTPGEDYLHETRCIDTRRIGDALERIDAIGWHPSVRFNQDGHELHGRFLGCIIGVMTDLVTAKHTGGISRTYVYNGRKVAKA